MRIEGLCEIASQFDAMLIDQFGVIHDGAKLYPEAGNVLHQLKRLGIAVVIMTNSGKRSAANVSRVVAMGVPRDHFVDCVSSGEVAYQSLAIKRAFVIGKRGEDYGFDGVELVATPSRAQVILILGSNAPETSLADYRELLQGLAQPAICCNPDKLMLTSQGPQPAPGAIAALYESMGGEVTWIGKPYPEIYHHALKLLGNPRRVLCVGDSAEHDVAGGRAAALSTLLVLQGVSASFAEADIDPYPDYIMPSFRWSA